MGRRAVSQPDNLKSGVAIPDRMASVSGWDKLDAGVIKALEMLQNTYGILTFA